MTSSIKLQRHHAIGKQAQQLVKIDRSNKHYTRIETLHTVRRVLSNNSTIETLSSFQQNDDESIKGLQYLKVVCVMLFLTCKLKQQKKSRFE